MSEPSNIPLTARQREILRRIYFHLVEHGRYPTVRELTARLGMKSNNGLKEHFTALRRKGYLDWEERKSRSLRLVGGRVVFTFNDTPEGDRLRGAVGEPPPAAAPPVLCSVLDGED